MTTDRHNAERAGRLALVTVTYNSGSVLEDFLASLDRQTSEAWDLIVVDNASTDGSSAMVEAWGGRLHALVQNSTNVGFAAATNQGMRMAMEAGYDAVLSINNDVRFDGDFIEALMNSPARDGVAVLAPVVRYAAQPERFWYAGGDFTWLRGAFQARMFETAPDGLDTWPADFAPGCCLLFERATLERVGLLDEQFFVYWEDVDWAYRCKLAGQPITVLRTPVLYHKVSVLTGGGTSPFGARMFHLGQVRFLRKHFPIWLRATQYPLMLGKVAARLATRRDTVAETKLRLQTIAEARRIAPGDQKPRVIVNLTAIGKALTGGTSRYAVSLFEAMVELVERERLDVAIEGMVQPEAAAHFSPRAREYLSHTPRLSNRVVRVAYENVLLPRRLRRRRAEALINPIFAGPVTGAQRIVTIVPDLYFRTIPHLMESRRRRYLALAVPRMVAASDTIIAISDSTAGEIRAAWPEAAARVVTVHPAARELPPASPLTWPRPYVLCVAVILPNKNISCIVAAIAQLNAAGHTVDLLHIGADPENLLAAAIANYGAEKLVHSLGAIDDEALASAYRGALALVIASLDEGFCLPVLEAQSSGTPVCTTPCGALREVAGEAALFFNPDQPETLAGHIQRLLQDSQHRVNIARAGRDNAARFSWQKTAAAVIAQALVSVKPVPADLGQERNTQGGEWQSAEA